MKMNTKTHTLETDINTSKTRNFEIKQNAHMLRILSDGIYSDKPMAVIRELSSNAWDAHIMAGTTDRPFDIHLPNPYEPYFSIRDYGIGLSEEDVYGLYCTYGGTNKDQSNDVTGGFGLGSKAGFAYTDQFTVTSVHNKRKMMFSAFVAENGEYQITKLSDEETQEHNGLEIYIPVKADDFATFQEKTKTVYSRYPLMPLIEGVSEFTPTKVEYLAETKDYRLRNEASKYSYRGSCHSYALQGLVAYKLDSNALKATLTNNQYAVLNGPFDLLFDIGEVSVAVSREHLSYDERTQTNILAKVDKVLEGLPKFVQAEVDSCKNLWEALLLYNKWYKESDLSRDLKEHVGENLTYKKIPLDKGRIKFNLSKMETVEDELEQEVPYAEIITYNKAMFEMKRITGDRKYKGSIYASPDTIFIWDDVESRTINPKIDYHFRDEDQNIVMIKADKKHLTSIKKQLGNPTVKKWSDYEEVPKDHFERLKSVSVVKKLLGYTERAYSELWEDTNHNVADGGLYIMTYAREPQLRDCRRGSLRDLVKNSRSLGMLEDSDKIFGIQSSFKNIPNQHQGWFQLEDYILDQFNKQYDLKDLPKKLAAFKELTTAFDNCYRIEQFTKKFVENDEKFISSRSAMFKVFRDYKRLQIAVGDIEEVRKIGEICRYFNIEIKEIKPQYSLHKSLEECKTRYPLLKDLHHNTNVEDAKHYIDVCDASPSITPKGA